MITPPLVLYDEGDVCVFKSVEDMERYVEAIDVRNAVYEAFDSKGRKLRLIIERRKKKGICGLLSGFDEFVVVRDAEGEQAFPHELVEVIQRFLVSIGVNQECLKKLSLDQLVAKLTFKIGYSR